MRPLPWLVVVVCVCSCDACSGSAHKTPTPPSAGSAVAPATPEAAGALSEAIVASYWTTPDELAGAQQFALDKWQPARDAFARARQATSDDPRAARIELMLGLCEEKLDNATDAATHFAFAYEHLPLLADYIGYHAARALWLAHKPDDALALAKKLDATSIVGPDTDVLIGDLLRGQGDRAAIVLHFRDYLKRHPDGPFRSEARFDLAEALERDPADVAEAVKLYRQIEIDDTLSSWATKAHARLDALKAPEDFTSAERITRATVLFDGMRNPESEAEFDAALADPKVSPGDKCDAAYHKAESRFKARDRKGAAPMFDDAAAACKTAGNTNLQIKANFRAGMSYSFFGKHEIAIARYHEVQTIDPTHSYADDGLLREAEEWKALGDDAKVEETLSALPQKFPNGDMVEEALWRLGFAAWRAQKYDDAIKWWNQLAAKGDGYDYVFGDYVRAEAGYWLGRAYAAKQQMPEAIAAWQTVAKTDPAAYYALLSLNRLREAQPATFQQVVAEISADPVGYDAKAPAFAFKARPEWSTPGFARAMELLRLGLGEPAGQELRKLKLTAPSDRKRVDDPDKVEKLWAIAFLYDRAHRYSTSHNPTRWNILDYRRQWPVGANRARWQIAYPLAYEELLRRHAQLNGVPFPMQIGIVREESGFDPLDESYANAIGLTQMIPPTAKDFAKGTGIDPTRENLRDPEMNVTIGSRFLGSLFKDWNGFLLLVPPSYNAGPAGVRRMLRARGTWDADEFVEGIVDDQARNYTKRVLGTFFTYSWLYQHEVPEIPNKIPTALLPK